MLVLSRKKSEVIVVGGSCAEQETIRIIVLQICNQSVKLGIEASASVPVQRMEVWARMQTDRITAKAS